MNSENKEQIKGFKKWLIAIRPFALPASITPVIFGTALAVFLAGAAINWLHFILALLGMMILHSGANILSDITDFNKGLDRAPTPVSGAVVRQLITVGQAWRAAVILMVAGTAIGLYLVTQVGMPLLVIGLIGVLVGILPFFLTLGFWVLWVPGWSRPGRLIFCR